jgi:hypothetical protein
MKQQLHKTKLTTVLFSILCSLFSIFSQAQDYQYEWAKSGGGGLSGSGSGFNTQQDETIWDVVIDADNNYYFLADLQGGTVNFEGVTLTHYGRKDIVIIALDCEGSFMWSHTVGGSHDYDNAYKLGLDSSSGLYVGVNVRNIAYISNLGIEYNFPPVHFSEDDVMPLIPYGYYGSPETLEPSEAYKTGFLLKFDKDTGELLWRKNLQGDVTSSTRNSLSGRIYIDSNDVIHQIVGLLEGTHLEGLVTLEEGEVKYFLVKYDTDGNILGIPQELPMTGGFGPEFTLFTYDEQLSCYYLAGMSGLSPTKTYGGVPLQETGFYILAFDGDTFEELWRRELLGQSGLYEEIKGIAIDEDSNIYLAGKYYISFEEDIVSYFGDYLLPQNIGDDTGNCPFTMKLNSSGAVQWIRTPDGFTTTSTTGSRYNRGITVNGNEVASLAGAPLIWGDFSIVRPNGHQSDPAILRLDKETGEVIGLHDIMGGAGNHNEFRVITTDNDGNYIAGGHFFGALTHPVTGEPMYGMGKTDFFMAKLSAYACGSGGNPCLGVEIDVPTGDNTQGVQLGMTLADLDVDGENLQWYADAELTEPLSENHIIENNTTYYVTQTLGGCTSEALAVTVSTLGVSDFQKIQIKLYPNPTSGLLYIETSQEVQSYEVYNLIGQQLLKGNVNDNINLKDLSKGTYIIRLTTQEGTVITEKVIKE